MSGTFDIVGGNPVEIGVRCSIDPTARLDTRLGPIVIRDDVVVGAGTIVFGNTVIGDACLVEEYVLLGKAERGYAMGRTYDGTRSGATLGPNVVLRPGVHVYDGVTLGASVAVGHSTVLRSDVTIGDESQLAHFVSVERGARLGRFVRSSPHTHLTGDLVVEDRVFFGAGVKTVNDQAMLWKIGSAVALEPPIIRRGAAIGSGATIAAGVEVGEWALVGSQSLVTRNVGSHTIVYGVPAKVRGRRDPTTLPSILNP